MTSSKPTEFANFLVQISMFYQTHTGCPFHTVFNEVDIEDIATYFLFILEEDAKKKQTKLLEAFKEL